MSRKNMKIPKGLTRSQKKRYINQQIALAKGREKIAKKINRVSKGYAKIFTTQPARNADVINRLGFCPDCRMNYCFDFSGRISWCHECSWQASCLKLHYPEDALILEEPVVIRQCPPCRWDELDILRAQTEQSLPPQSRWRERRFL